MTDAPSPDDFAVGGVTYPISAGSHRRMLTRLAAAIAVAEFMEGPSGVAFSSIGRKTQESSPPPGDKRATALCNWIGHRIDDIEQKVKWTYPEQFPPAPPPKVRVGVKDGRLIAYKRLATALEEKEAQS